MSINYIIQFSDGRRLIIAADTPEAAKRQGYRIDRSGTITNVRAA